MFSCRQCLCLNFHYPYAVQPPQHCLLYKLFAWFIRFLSTTCHNTVFTSPKASLLGLLAKIMCSICSCQLNIWHAGHCLAPILNWFLTSGLDNGACSSPTTDCPGLTLPPGTVHSPIWTSAKQPQPMICVAKSVGATCAKRGEPPGLCKSKSWNCPTQLAIWGKHAHTQQLINGYVPGTIGALVFNLQTKIWLLLP